MRVEMLSIPGLPAPLGPYAHATVIGDQIMVSGLLALDAEGRVVGAGDVAAQAEHILGTLGRILGAAGATPADVAKITIYLVDLADRTAIASARARFFGAHRPASTLVQVAGLVGEGTRVEIEAVAVRPRG